MKKMGTNYGKGQGGSKLGNATYGPKDKMSQVAKVAGGSVDSGKGNSRLIRTGSPSNKSYVN